MNKIFSLGKLALYLFKSKFSMSQDCLFCKLVSGQILAKEIYRDENILAFHDINPQAPVHFLVIPTKHIDSLNHVLPSDSECLGKIQEIIPQLARKLNIFENGYRVVQNNGANAGQTVFHIHYHVLGGRGLKWPPG